MNRERPAFEYEHHVTYEDTNAVGNVYFTNFLSWQGKCRELFLQAKAPETFRELQSGELRMVTSHASCDYFEEALAGERLIVRLRLDRYVASGVSLAFEYVRPRGGAIARGRQEVRFLRKQGSIWAVCEMPRPLAEAVRDYE